ncbi:MAG: (2Fe-2S)-binding protein [Actinomycetota bacterium]
MRARRVRFLHTVLVDGNAVCSCLVMAATCVDTDITTVEGLGDGHALTDVPLAFVEAGGVQCGFCTPGLIVAVHDLLEDNPTPTTTQVKEALSGNICRCTGYGRIFDAVQLVISRRAEATR